MLDLHDVMATCIGARPGGMPDFRGFEWRSMHDVLRDNGLQRAQSCSWNQYLAVEESFRLDRDLDSDFIARQMKCLEPLDDALN